MIAVMKTSLIVIAGLGLTWAAGQVSDAVLNPASAKVVLAQADNPADSLADQADSTPSELDSKLCEMMEKAFCP